jgi:hypothetical protein
MGPGEPLDRKFCVPAFQRVCHYRVALQQDGYYRETSAVQEMFIEISEDCCGVTTLMKNLLSSGNGRWSIHRGVRMPSRTHQRIKDLRRLTPARRGMSEAIAFRVSIKLKRLKVRKIVLRDN